jgi:nitrile hydratase subunit beta
VNGAHDLGGMHGFGAIEREPNEPVFHAHWERRVFALTMAMGATGEWTIDRGRFARENRPPAAYLTKTYYELWLAGLEHLLAETKLVTPAETAAGKVLEVGRPIKRVLAAADVARVLAAGTRYERPASAPARFRPGDAVRAKTMNPAGHTRLPRYVRGHVGVIEAVNGFQVFADASAAGEESAQWLYTVAFEGRELWGPDSDPTVAVSINAWESYLEPL